MGKNFNNGSFRKKWDDLYEGSAQTLVVDKESAQDYIIGGDDVGRLRVIVDHLKTDWPELADTLNEVLTNLVEV
jgi:hypothetical protein